MKKQYKGFYGIGNNFPCNATLTHLSSKIDGLKDLYVVHLEKNPSDSILFDRALTIYPEDNVYSVLPDEDLYGSPVTMEHFALIVIAPRKDIDAIYDNLLNVFSDEGIQKIVQEDAEGYDTTQYSFHQANLINGTSLLHFAQYSGILDYWNDIKEKLMELGVWNNIQYVLEPDDLFNCYFNDWFLENTSLEFAQAYYDTFKGHILFPKKEDIMRKSVLDKIKT